VLRSGRVCKQMAPMAIRVGVAQNNFAAGEGLPALMQALGWRDARTGIRYRARLATKGGSHCAVGQAVQR